MHSWTGGLLLMVWGMFAIVVAPYAARFARAIQKSDEDFESAYRWRTRFIGLLFIALGVWEFVSAL